MNGRAALLLAVGLGALWWWRAPKTAPELAYRDTKGGLHAFGPGAKPSVVVFWVSPCPYCERALTVLDDLRWRFPEDRLDVVGIYLNPASDAEVDEIGKREGRRITLAGAQHSGSLDLVRALDSGFGFGAPGREIYVVDAQGKMRAIDSSDLGYPTGSLETLVIQAIGKATGLAPNGASARTGT